MAIKDLADFSDGVLLLNLLEVVSGKSVPRYPYLSFIGDLSSFLFSFNFAFNYHYRAYIIL